jgi:hypothetical protein
MKVEIELNEHVINEMVSTKIAGALARSSARACTSVVRSHDGTMSCFASIRARR